MYKKTVVLILSIAIVLLSTLVVAGCEPDPVEGVRGIELEDGALKEVYRVDETIDYSNAYLLVTYTGGRVQRVQITPNMVSGFSTDIPSNQSTMTVSFAGYSVEWIYRVIGSSEAANSFRLNVSVSEDNTVSVSASGTENFTALGVMFEVVMTGMSLNYNESDPESAVEVAAEGMYCSVIGTGGASFKTVLWAKDGRTPMTDGVILTFKIRKKGTEKAILTLQKATVSDGAGDYSVPQSTIEIS